MRLREKFMRYWKKKPPREVSNRPFLRRTLVVMICMAVAFVPLFITLFRLMIVNHSDIESTAISNQTRSTAVPADRGVIYDCNMNALATSETVENVFISPNEIAEKKQNLDLIASGLAQLLDVEESFVREQAADTSMYYKVIKRKIDEDLADQVRKFINDNDISGVYLESDSQRTYPYSTVAAQVIGFTNAENVGSEGLEAYYDDLLKGTSGAVITTKGNNGTEMLYSYEKYYEASDGDSLVLTADSTVQYYLEKNMEAAIEKYDVLNGAFGIVMDVNSGEIKAMATLGSYDPNSYLDIYDEKTLEELDEQYQKAMEAYAKAQTPSLNGARATARTQTGAAQTDEPNAEDASESEETEGPVDYAAQYEQMIADYNNGVVAARLKQWRNRAVSDGYEPGSTFKTITLSAALEEGAVKLEDSWYCSGSAQIQGRDDLLHCWKATGHGAQNTAQALQNSCNIAFANIGIKLGGEKLYEYVKAFGLLEKTGIDLPGEASGYFFSEETLANPQSYASLTSAAFGQTFKVTPIQLVRAIAAVVNGGYVLKPYIVSEVLDADGNVVEKNERTVLRQAISEETSQLMCQLMESVVTEGTASNAKVAGYAIGGKTGTSEKVDEFDENGNMVEDKIVSFVGVAPIDNPQYIVLVALDTPSTATGYYISGGVMAAPTVRDVFADILPYLGVAADYSDEDISQVNMTMPNVIGLSRDEAAQAIQDENLQYEFVGEGNTVTDQIPASGSELPGNSTVLLYLGEEKPTDLVTVPNLLGLTAYEANITITNTGGLYLQTKGSMNSTSTVTVTSQSIPAGTQVERGTLITIELTDSSAQD